MNHDCGTCRFSSPEIVDFDAAGNAEPTPILLCHRYPPTMFGIGEEVEMGAPAKAVMAFPQVQSTDWCGEWGIPDEKYDVPRTT